MTSLPTSTAPNGSGPSGPSGTRLVPNPLALGPIGNQRTQTPGGPTRNNTRSRGYCLTAHTAPGTPATAEAMENIHNELVNEFHNYYIVSGVEIGADALQRQLEEIQNGNELAQADYHLQGLSFHFT